MRGRSVGVLLEVNESGEESKSGCAPERALELAEQIAAPEGVELQGLMTVGAHVRDERRIREGFAHLRGLREQIRSLGVPGTARCMELSMGMSGDLEYAIAEGRRSCAWAPPFSANAISSESRCRAASP